MTKEDLAEHLNVLRETMATARELTAELEAIEQLAKVGSDRARGPDKKA